MSDSNALADAIRQQTEVLAQMSKEMTGRKNDPSSQSATWPNLYNQGGLFGLGGARPDLYNLTQRPIDTFSTTVARNMQRSQYQNEVYEVVTGYLPGTGANANGVCDPAPKTGRFKVCRQVIPFGCYKKGTEVTAVPQLGMFRDYSITPRTINNFNPAESPFMPDVIGRMANPIMDIDMQLYRLGFDVEIDTATVMASGNPAKTGSARTSGWISEFKGLTNWITTGYVDSVTGIACPSADSVVYNWNNDISGTGQGNLTVGVTISEAVRNLYRSVWLRARGMGMGDTVFAFVGSYKLFYALVDVIACEYAFTRCNTTSSRDVIAEGTMIVNMRNEMFNGEYLRIDDKVIPFLFLEELPENVTGNSVYTADLFIVPLSWRGAPLTYMEYFPQDNPYVRQAMPFIPEGMMSIINGGLYTMFSNFKEGCLELSLYMCSRLVMRMPSLAGRLDNLSFSYLVQSRDAQIGRSLYADGGISIRI